MEETQGTAAFYAAECLLFQKRFLPEVIKEGSSDRICCAKICAQLVHLHSTLVLRFD